MFIYHSSDWDSQQAFAGVGGTLNINMSSPKAPPRGPDCEAIKPERKNPDLTNSSETLLTRRCFFSSAIPVEYCFFQTFL